MEVIQIKQDLQLVDILRIVVSEVVLRVTKPRLKGDQSSSDSTACSFWWTNRDKQCSYLPSTRVRTHIYMCLPMYIWSFPFFLFPFSYPSCSVLWSTFLPFHYAISTVYLGSYYSLRFYFLLFFTLGRQYIHKCEFHLFHSWVWSQAASIYLQ